MVNPRHWPEDVWHTADNAERPKREWRQAETPADELRPKTYQLDGESVGFARVQELCLSSFEGLQATLQKLKDQNQYVSDLDLIREAVPHHIDGAPTVEILDRIAQFIRNEATWPDARQLERLGRRYLALGEVERGLESLEDAIGRLMDYGEDIRAPFATLVTYDRERARKTLISRIGKVLESSHGGFKMPRTVAVACDILGDVESLTQVFDDFLQHCQELFAELPDDRWFDELRDWTDVERDEKTQIVDLLVDRLESPAIEASNRLLSALCELCSTTGHDVLPTLTRRAVAAEGLQLYRLLTIVLWLGAKHPRLMQDQCEPLLALLNRKNAFVRLSVVKALRLAFGETPLPETGRQAVEAVERQYASTVSYRGFGLIHVEPSGEFRSLFWEGTTAELRRKLLAACNILHLDQSAMMAHLERRLLASGSTLENEREEIQEMWRAHAHAQGWPVIFFFPGFEVKISECLYEALDEILTKQSHTQHRVDALWDVLNPCDPDYLSYELLPMPADIRPLAVTDSEQWLSGDSGFIVTIGETPSSEWLTVFEFRQLAQDDPYHVPYVVQTHVRSALVLPEIAQQIGSLEASLPWQEDVEPKERGENITWGAFQLAVSEPSHEQVDADSAGIPVIAVSSTHADFLSFRNLASFSSLVFGGVGLTCRGFDVFQGSERVGYFEAWQEGYPDEDYNDLPMAYGVRFRARAKFIQQVCQRWGRAFAIQETEHRWLFKSFERDPVRSKTIKRVTVLPVV